MTPKPLALAKRKKKVGKLNCVTGVRLQNYGILSLTGSNFQSTFSRTFTSFSKHKLVNANGYNSATRYFNDKRAGAYADSLKGGLLL